MSKKVKTKGRAAASKLRSKGKLRAKKKAARKPASKTHKKAAIAKTRTKSIQAVDGKKKIVRIMGHGQFTVNGKTLKKLNDIDSAIVELVSRDRSDDLEFKKRLTELNDMVMNNGKPLDPKEIIKSDIILPSADLSIDEAKSLFRGEGVIPEL
jgi:hypothetical protein